MSNLQKSHSKQGLKAKQDPKVHAYNKVQGNPTIFI